MTKELKQLRLSFEEESVQRRIQFEKERTELEVEHREALAQQRQTHDREVVVMKQEHEQRMMALKRMLEQELEEYELTQKDVEEDIKAKKAIIKQVFLLKHDSMLRVPLPDFDCECSAYLLSLLVRTHALLSYVYLQQYNRQGKKEMKQAKEQVRQAKKEVNTALLLLDVLLAPCMVL